MHATGEFDVKTVPQPPVPGHDPAVVGRLSLEKTYHGPLEATAEGQMLAHQTATKGSAGYVAIEKVSGTLHGRRGSFVLQHRGTMGGGTLSLEVQVIPDSGSDELVGISGSMQIVVEGKKHSYVLEYALP